jgi:MOSC domain-containing protein YiiM/GNAT superfamily N-acetyltransferase
MADTSAGVPTTGRVVQVNVSAGGVPKLPVERAWVGRLGVEGDAHREATVHGGPHRAVCLFAMEAIERLQSEGHPIEPGSAGENLTTSGIEWSLLPVGTRARVGDQVEIELASSTTPCATQKGNFIGGRFSRMSIELHPSDSRMYARVLREGEVRTGDPITVLPPASDSRALDWLLLGRLDRAEMKSSVAAWQAAAEAGYAVEFEVDGELAMCASRDIPGPAFNHASGLTRLPNMLTRVTEFYDTHGTTGYLGMDEAPWPDSKVSLVLDIFAAPAEVMADAPVPEGVVIRRIQPGETAAYTAVRSGNPTAGGVSAGGPNPWPDVYERLARASSRMLFVAELDGTPVGNGSLHIGARTGWLRGTLVAPEARGRGIQRALIAARVRAAIEAGCDLVGASAEPDGVSARNLERTGMRRIGTRTIYEYVPRTAEQ